MAAERAGQMMVLSVDIVRDGTADGQEPRSGSHGNEPSRRHDELQDVIEQHARFALQDALLTVETNEAIELARTQQRAACVETAVAIAARIAEWQHGAVGRFARERSESTLEIEHNVLGAQ